MAKAATKTQSKTVAAPKTPAKPKAAAPAAKPKADDPVKVVIPFAEDLRDNAHRASEKASDIALEMGAAFGRETAKATGHADDDEDVPFADYVSKYQPRLEKTVKGIFPGVTGVAIEVVLRTANLHHNGYGDLVPSRREIKKLDGMSDVTVGDTVFRKVLTNLQQEAGLTPTRKGNGGSRQGAGRKAKGSKATKGGKPVPAAVQQANSANSAPAVQPTVDVKKVREDAAASLMGSARYGDMLLAALDKNKAALLKYLEKLTQSA